MDARVAVWHDPPVRHHPVIFFFCLWIVVGAAAAEEVHSLLQDATFARGFHVLAPPAGQRVVSRTFPLDPAGAEPVWDIAQWNSRHDLSTNHPAESADGEWTLRDSSKSVGLVRSGEGAGRIRLELDGTREFRMPRRDGQPWPHLLIQQAVTNCPPIAALSSVDLTLEGRLTGRDHDDSGHDPGLHCAQCPLVLIVQNRNAASAGYGDFFWFQVPLYDDRWEYPPPHVAMDTADPSAKLIYNPGLRAYTDATLYHGGWVRLDLDLLPHLVQGLTVAREKGYLPGSSDPKDFRITSFILGWEVTGRNRGGIEFRGLSLKAVKSGS